MHISLRTTLEILLVQVLTLSAATAQSPVMFRSVMPDGKIVYGDKAAPGAKESKRVNLAPLNIAAPQQAPDTAAAPDAAQTAKGDGELAAARQNLDAAQKALVEGREQREGDRIGIARAGGSRPSDSYLDRVKGLEDAVAAAQQQLEAAQRSAR